MFSAHVTELTCLSPKIETTLQPQAITRESSQGKYVSIFELFSDYPLCSSSSIKFRAFVCVIFWFVSYIGTKSNLVVVLLCSVWIAKLSPFFNFCMFFILLLCENFVTVDDSRFLAVPLRRSLRFGSSTVSVKSSRGNKFQQETHVKCYYAFLYQQQHQGKGNDEGSSSYWSELSSDSWFKGCDWLLRIFGSPV